MKNIDRIMPFFIGMLLMSFCSVTSFSQNIISTIIPSDLTPDNGDNIIVGINLDMSNMASPDNKLGSFTGTLQWNPEILNYVSHSGILAGFAGIVNDSDAAAGELKFNGTNSSGLEAIFDIVSLNFQMVGNDNIPVDLNLEYSAMSAAITFENLLPYLGTTTSIMEESLTGKIPQRYVLKQNYPNPFSMVSYIPFGLPEAGSVKIEIYDTAGKRQHVLSQKQVSAGYHVWNIDASGIGLSTGVYYYKFYGKDFFAVKKMVVARSN